MDRNTLHPIALLLAGVILVIFPVSGAAAGAEDVARGHTQFTSVVAKKAGALVVTTPNGATHQLNENMARRHGQKPFKAGDEVIVVLDENNYIVDMHLKGKEGAHQWVTGKLIHVGRMKKQIKLQTPDGEKVFPLAEEGQKTKGMEEGELVTVELNEAGTVIDMHRADIGGTH
jgi:outer membrane lipoprotein-sorting protein